MKRLDKIRTAILLLICLTIVGCKNNLNKSTANKEAKSSKLLYILRKEDNSLNFDNIEYKFVTATLEKGNIVSKNTLFSLKSGVILKVRYFKDEDRLNIITKEGTIYEYNLPEQKLLKINPKEEEILITDCFDFTKDGKGVLFTDNQSVCPNIIRMWQPLKNPSRTNPVPLIAEMEKKEIETGIFDCRFIPNSNDKQLVFQGMKLDLINVEKSRGILTVYDIDADKTLFEKIDYGVFDSYNFTIDYTAAKGPSPKFSLSPDGKKAAYIADFETPIEEKDKLTNKKDKYNTLAAYVINLEDPNAAVIKIAGNQPPTGWTSWSKDGKYIVVTGQLYKIEGKRFVHIPVKEKFAPDVVTETDWSSDGKYFASFGDYGECEGYILYIPDRKVIKLSEGASFPMWIN